MVKQFLVDEDNVTMETIRKDTVLIKHALGEAISDIKIYNTSLNHYHILVSFSDYLDVNYKFIKCILEGTSCDKKFIEFYIKKKGRIFRSIKRNNKESRLIGIQ